MFSTPLLLGLIDIRAEHAVISQMYRDGLLKWRDIAFYVLASSPLRLVFNIGPRYMFLPAIAALGPCYGSIYISLLIIQSSLNIMLSRLFKSTVELSYKPLLDESMLRKAVGVGKVLRACLLIALRFTLVYTVIEIVMKIVSLSPLLNSLSPHKAPLLYIAISTTLMPTSRLFVLRDMINSGMVSLAQGLMTCS